MPPPIACFKCDSEQIQSRIVAADSTHQEKTLMTCLNCGNEWEPKYYERDKKNWLIKQQEIIEAARKAEFYAAVEANDMAKATVLMNELAELKGKFTKPKDAYDYLKKEDKKSNYIIIGAVVIFVIIIVLFLMDGNF